jgi:hypothetical protein
MKLFLISLLLVLSTSASAQTTRNRTITIEPHLSFQNYEHFKRLTLKSPDSNIEFLEDFDFEWGYVYKLSVKETRLAQTWSDGTQYEYSLNRVVSKTKVSDFSEFKLFLDADRYYYELDSSEQSMNATLKALDDSTYLYFDEVEIEVPSRLKPQFEKIVSGEKSCIGYFVFIDEKRIRLERL